MEKPVFGIDLGTTNSLIAACYGERVELINNALGSVLTPSAVALDDDGRVLVGCRNRGNSLSIEVLDSGAGIPAEQLGAIFDAFHQINPASEGLGLGLSIVRRTAEALGHPPPLHFRSLRSILWLRC